MSEIWFKLPVNSGEKLVVRKASSLSVAVLMDVLQLCDFVNIVYII